MVTKPPQGREEALAALEKLRRSYLARLPERLTALEQALAQVRDAPEGTDPDQGLESLRSLAHKFAGGAGTFGLARLGEQARQLELQVSNLLEQGTQALWQEGLAVLEQSLEGLWDEVRAADVPAATEAGTYVADQPHPAVATTVLLVEDSQHQAEAMASLLANFGFEVHVEPGVDGLAQRVTRHPPDVLVMDIILDDEREAGLVAVQDLREANLISFPVIFLSVRDDVPARLRAVRAGGDAYMPKPANIVELVDTIERLLNSRREIPYRVLVVDDEVEIAEHTGLVLESAGMVVNTVTEPLQTVDAMHQMEPDLLLLDIDMPDCNGREMARLIRQIREFMHVPIVYLTGHASDEQRLASLRAGGDDFILKNVPDQELVATVLLRAERGRQLNTLLGTLKASEQRFRSVSQSASEGILCVDHEGFIVLWNQGAEKIFGYREQEILGRSVTELVPDVSREDLRKALAACRTSADESGDCLPRELNARRKDGSLFPAEFALAKWVAEHRMFVTAIVHDATERKRTKDALERKVAQRTAEVYLRDRAMEAASEGIVMTDPTRPGHPIVYANPAFEEMSGYSEEDLLGRELFFQNGDDQDQEGLIELRKALAEQGSCQVELRNYRRDGSHYWGELTVFPILDADERCIRFVAFQSDVTERKRADAELRLAAGVFESSGQGIMVTGADKRILRANQAFLDISGYTLEEVLGRTPGFVRSGRQDEAIYQSLWATLDIVGYWQGELFNRRKNGEIHPVWETITAVQNAEGKIEQYISVMSDITEQKLTEARIRHLAHYDVLTELANRVLFIERCQQALVRADRAGNRAALMFLDLDNFKHINDSLGHSCGDSLLQEVAKRLSGLFREQDTIARLGGDEFVVVLESVQETDAIASMAEKINALFRESFMLAGHEVHVSASVGVSLYPDDGSDVETLVRNADAAMYLAKEAGRDSYRFYTAELTENALERVQMETRLRQGLERDEFIVYFQPKYRLKDGGLVGTEALLRWQDPERGLVMPDRFIPLTETSGLIVPIGGWVLQEACKQIKAWQDLELDPPRVSVNLAPRQLCVPDLATTVRTLLEEIGLDQSLLELELTESALMQNAAHTRKVLGSLRDLGVRIAMDDFGTGYSSMNYLRSFPLDVLKIDSSFVRDLATDTDADAIVAAIVTLANTLGLEVVAEGVETEAQVQFLNRVHCDVVQGNLFGAPLPAGDFEILLRKRKQG